MPTSSSNSPSGSAAMLARSASSSARFISHSVRSSVYRAPPAAEPPARMTAVPASSRVLAEAPALMKPSATPAADVMPSLMSRIDFRARSRRASRLSLVMLPRSKSTRSIEPSAPYDRRWLWGTAGQAGLAGRGLRRGQGGAVHVHGLTAGRPDPQPQALARGRGDEVSAERAPAGEQVRPVGDGGVHRHGDPLGPVRAGQHLPGEQMVVVVVPDLDVDRPGRGQPHGGLVAPRPGLLR